MEEKFELIELGRKKGLQEAFVYLLDEVNGSIGEGDMAAALSLWHTARMYNTDIILKIDQSKYELNLKELKILLDIIRDNY